MAVVDRLVPLEDGPFTRMIDSPNPVTRVEGAYTLGQNVYPQDPELGEELVGRPGSRPLGGSFGATNAHAVNGLGQFRTATADFTVAIYAGEIYTLDWTTEAWTKQVTTADLTTAGISLQTTSAERFAMVPAFDQLLVSGGIDAPFLWDGTAHGGLTALTACPPLYGVPTVHQARLFGIKATDRRTMVWSEADDPTTGYETGGFTNAWTLRQTDPYPLTRLVGTNQGLVIFREQSCTLAVGDVGTLEFQSSDTQEAIDAKVGTKTPWAVVEIGRNIVFLDALLRPHLIRPGATGVVPLWHDFRTTLRNGAHRSVDQWSHGVYYTPANLILFAVPQEDYQVDMMLVLSAATETPTPVAVWNGWGAESGENLHVMTMVRRPTLSGVTDPVPTLIRAAWPTNLVYLHGNPDDDTFLTDDITAAGLTQPIYHLVYGQPLGYSAKREKVFDRLDVSFRANTAQSALLWVRTARGDSDPLTVAVNATVSEAEVKASLGLDEQARWIAPRIAHQVAGERFGLVAFSVTAYASDDDPKAP